MINPIIWGLAGAVSNEYLNGIYGCVFGHVETFFQTFTLENRIVTGETEMRESVFKGQTVRLEGM